MTATYTLPLPEDVGDVSVGVTYSYSSSQYSNFGTLRNPGIIAATGGFDTSRMAPRNLINLNFDWNGVGGGPIDFAVFATNVTNENYYTDINGLIGLGFETATVGEPRMFGARVKIHFGGGHRLIATLPPGRGGRSRLARRQHRVDVGRAMAFGGIAFAVAVDAQAAADAARAGPVRAHQRSTLR